MSFSSTFTVLFLICLNHAMSSNCPPAEDVYPCLCTEYGNYKDMKISGYCAGISSLDQLRTSINSFRGLTFWRFTIEKSKFEYMPSDLFKNTRIKHLDIIECKLTRIGNLGEPQFQGLEESLESLTIKYSFTREHPFANVFIDNLKKLSTMDISNNHVEVLHNEWFKNGPLSLTTVRFYKGEIRAVGYKALNSLSDLKLLDLSDNQISDLARSSLPQPAQHLVELNLERNKLLSLTEDIFTDMPSLKIINLELNDLATIDEAIWTPVWSNLQTINVDYNPIICDSKIKWIYSMGHNLESKLTATCYKPFKLMDRDLHSLKPEEIK